MREQNYYEFLGIPFNASKATILKAIANIEKQDKDRRYAGKLLTVKHTLTDAKRRKAYDRLVQQAPPATTIADFDDFSLNEQPALNQYTSKYSQSSESNHAHSKDDWLLNIEGSDDIASNHRHEDTYVDNISNAYTTNSQPSYQVYSQQIHTQDEANTEQQNATNPYHKDRLTAAWLAFFSLGLGLHRFWLGQPVLGFVYLFFNLITGGLVSVATFVEAILIYRMSDEKWIRLHGTHNSNYPGKDKHAAGLLAYLGGFVGAHRYYLGQWQRGLFYTLFSWTLIPFLVSLVEGTIFLQTSDERWNERYGHVKNTPLGCLTVVLIPVAMIVIIFAYLLLIASMHGQTV